MLIPVCCERLPVRIEVSVICAKGLPIMNKSINNTDAFVEVRFADETEKTEVVTSLNPQWNSETFNFDTDEKELSEEFLQFRVMDHDTYSANDAIGRVNLDCNIVAEKMRMQDKIISEEVYTLPIYDTLNGVRGELVFSLNVHLLIQYDYSNYVQIFTGYHIPKHLRLIEVIGMIHDIKVEMDPDYEWLDRIRSPRATNEARQSTIREVLRSAAVSLSHKADKHQANVIVGYQEYLDVEGSSSDLLTVRICGTALRVTAEKEQLCAENAVYPILTIGKVPHTKQTGVGSLVSARSIRILEEGEDAESNRKSWWNELRVELYQQAVSLGCNLVIGYTEQMAVHDGIAVMGCSATAVQVANDFPEMAKPSVSTVVEQEKTEKKIKEPKEKRLLDGVPRPPIDCSLFHTSLLPGKTSFSAKTSKCSICGSGEVVDFLLQTTPCPPPHYFVGARNFIQVSVSKKISSDPDDQEDYAQELSNALPFADHELFSSLMGEAKNLNSSANAVFDIRFNYAISDDLLVVVATGILVRLLAIPKDEVTSPSLSNVLSFTSLQRYNDSRRFSWGTVREAIRFKPSITPSLTLKILNLKPPMMESLDDSSTSSNKGKLRLHAIVGKLKRRQHEREYVSHVIFERHISTSIGFLEPQAAGNSNAIAGVHVAPNMNSLVLNRDQADCLPVLSRWSDIFVREDLSTSVKDSTSVDAFVTNALEERVSHIKAVALLGGPGTVSNLRVACPQFTVSKEHAHMIILISCDINGVEH